MRRRTHQQPVQHVGHQDRRRDAEGEQTGRGEGRRAVGEETPARVPEVLQEGVDGRQPLGPAVGFPHVHFVPEGAARRGPSVLVWESLPPEILDEEVEMQLQLVG